MNKLNTIRALCALLLAAPVSGAVSAAPVQPVKSIRVISSEVQRSETKLMLSSVLDVAPLRNLKTNREVWIRPVIYSNQTADSLALPEFCLAGHNRYVILQRQARNDAGRRAVHRSSTLSTFPVDAIVDFQPWMQDARVEYLVSEAGCCSYVEEKEIVHGPGIDFMPRVFEVTDWVYITPPAEVKTRALSGSAYIDFPVNRTELYPDYRRNPEELKSIQATIDVVEKDSDIHIDSLSVIGYASPEGPWDNNVRLAAGRTTTLIEYIRDLYSFPDDILRKGSVPEDWEGLIKHLKLTDIANRDAIMAIAADTSIEPDARNSMIQRKFPVQYKWILQNIYPALRHSDYTVYYTVADYTDPQVIGSLIYTNPGKLSLGEMFTYANTLDPDSEEFRKVFDIAVQMYPDNEIANINAANTALRQGYPDLADRYLKKAGHSPEAEYLRGISAALRQDYTTALPFFEKASAAGFTKADAAIRQLRDKRLIRE